MRSFPNEALDGTNDGHGIKCLDARLQPSVYSEAMRHNYFALTHYEMLSMSSMLAVARAWMMRVHVVIDQQIDYLESY